MLKTILGIVSLNYGWCSPLIAFTRNAVTYKTKWNSSSKSQTFKILEACCTQLYLVSSCKAWLCCFKLSSLISFKMSSLMLDNASFEMVPSAASGKRSRLPLGKWLPWEQHPRTPQIHMPWRLFCVARVQDPSTFLTIFVQHNSNWSATFGIFKLLWLRNNICKVHICDNSGLYAIFGHVYVLHACNIFAS